MPRYDDIQPLFENYCQDPDVALYAGWPPHQSLEDTIGFIQRALAGWVEGYDFSWALTFEGRDEPWGMIGVHAQGEAAEVGYVLAKPLWNRGLMSRAVKKVLEVCQAAGRFRRLYAIYDTANPASGRVMVKSGMRFVCRQSQRLSNPRVGPGLRDAFLYELEGRGEGGPHLEKRLPRA